MTRKTRLASAVIAAAIAFGTAASAAPVTIPFEAIGERITDRTVGIDLFGGFDFGDGGTVTLRDPDGIGDLYVTDEAGYGLIEEAYVPPFDIDPIEPQPGFLPVLGGPFAVLGIAMEDNIVKAFATGEDIASHSSDGWGPGGFLYGDDLGPLASIGDRGIFGLRIQVLQDLAIPIEYDGDDCQTAELTPENCVGFGFETIVLANFFGYIDITRGSIVVNQIALNDSADEELIAGSLSAVPLPAGGLLLLAGLGSLLVLRRKRA